MAKVIKKIFLLFVLVSSLLKQLFISLSLLSLNCIKKHPKTTAISTGIVLAAICAIVPSVFTSNSSQANSKLTVGLNNSSANNLIAQSKSMFTTESGHFSNTANITETSKTLAPEAAVDKLNQTFAEIDGIAFQATHLSGSSSTGRSEPFAPVVGGLDAITGPNGASGKPLTPEEIAIQKAEARRNQIRDTLNNNVTVKGIVVDSNNKRPLAVVEITKPDGSSEIKTVLPGEKLYFADCLAKVTKISQDKISLSSEDVKVDRFIPDFNDDAGKAPAASSSAPTTEAASSTSSDAGKGNLLAPPTPKTNVAGKSGTSAGNTKKQIEDIDKLLDSI